MNNELIKREAFPGVTELNDFVAANIKLHQIISIETLESGLIQLWYWKA